MGYSKPSPFLQLGYHAYIYLSEIFNFKTHVSEMSTINQSDPIFLSWLAEFNTHIYRISFKAPLLCFEPSTAQNYASPAACISFKILKIQSKRFILCLLAEGTKND